MRIQFGKDQDERANFNIFYNVGFPFDIPNSTIVTGAKGEKIINGGMQPITGMTGSANTYKSIIGQYLSLAYANVMCTSTPDLQIILYDTEDTVSIARLENLASKFEHIPPNPITGENPIWDVYTKSRKSGDKFSQDLYEYYEAKIKDKSKLTLAPFVNIYTKKPLEIKIPTLVMIDSLTEFDPEASMDVVMDSLTTSDSNTLFLREGLFKTKFLKILQTIANTAEIKFVLTAHMGDKKNLATGPAAYGPPNKQLQHMKTDKEMKGVTSKLIFLSNVIYESSSVSNLANPSTKEPEYPSKTGCNLEKDMNIIKIMSLRNKGGTTGSTLGIVATQSEGVMKHLTAFHYIKENNRYGLDGSTLSYELVLRPGVKLSRTTVRDKFDNDYKLARALALTAELHQFSIYHSTYLSYNDRACDPKTLYDDIAKAGYDWDELLDTRGYWIPDQYNKDMRPFLSIIDLILLRAENKVPYFIDAQTKRIKKEYIGKWKTT